MKAFLFATLLSTFTANSFACSCARPNYGLDTAEEILRDFMSDKWGVGASQIREVKNVESRDYLSRPQRAFNALFPLSECELSCEYAQNSDEDYQVTYSQGGKACLVEVRVVLISKSIRSGYKSKVSTKSLPVCR